MTNHANTMRDLLGEVRGNFTRDDDMPDGLLGRIDRVIERFDNRDERDAMSSLYAQRNELAVAFCKAALAAGWLAGRGFDDDKGKDWADEWRHVVYVALPGGQQVSWHIAPTELHLLEGLPQFTRGWDGTHLGRTPGWSNEIEWVTVATDPRWAGVDYEKMNADMRDLLAQVDRLRKTQPNVTSLIASAHGIFNNPPGRTPLEQK